MFVYFADVKAIGIDAILVPYAEARIDPLDLGLHRGYAVFDYFAVHDGLPSFLPDYLRRFRASGRRLGLGLQPSDEELSEHLRTLAAANELTHGGCKLILTGGPSADGFTPERSRLYTYAFAKTPNPEAAAGGPPIRINLLEYAREWPAIKTTNYVATLALQGQQVATGASEIIYHHGGYISEASRSNVFVVTERGELWTPPTETALRGVTRHHVTAAARKAGLTVLERSMPVAALTEAAEVFLTGSGRQVQAVGQVQEHVVGEGGVGPVTRRVAALFAERARERAGWELRT